ncbi:MAG: hypothetical protein IJ189_12570 [Clostridia bacterium]|nr:hypothetical protein [Clostridia bacterium]
MSDEMVIRCCAPTLAAIKTGSLFNCAFESQEELTGSLRLINRCRGRFRCDIKMAGR